MSPHSLFAETPWLDSFFEEKLRAPGADYAQVALQAARILEPGEVTAMALVRREDDRQPTNVSENFLDLARFTTMAATLAWDAGHRHGYENPMDLAREVLARTVRVMVFIRTNTLDDMMRVVASELLTWCWHITQRERYAWNMAIRAISHMAVEDLLRHGQERTMACFRHLMTMAQGFLDEGSWNAEKTAEMIRWAEFAFLGFGEPDEKAVAITRKEMAWANRRREEVLNERLRNEIEDKLDALGSLIEQRHGRAFSDSELKV